jgi:hypothetical protein
VTALGRQFDPHKLAYGEEVTVDPEEFAAHPDIRRDERDPQLGGQPGRVYDNAMDDFAPGHGMDLKHASLSRDEVKARAMAKYEIGARYRQQHGEDFYHQKPEAYTAYRSEIDAPDLETSSLTGDQYITAIGNSMAAVGQQEPGILFSDPTGAKPFWLGEGNHRLAAARRTGAPYRVKRRDKG